MHASGLHKQLVFTRCDKIANRRAEQSGLATYATIKYATLPSQFEVQTEFRFDINILALQWIGQYAIAFDEKSKNFGRRYEALINTSIYFSTRNVISNRQTWHHHFV